MERGRMAGGRAAMARKFPGREDNVSGNRGVNERGAKVFVARGAGNNAGYAHVCPQVQKVTEKRAGKRADDIWGSKRRGVW